MGRKFVAISLILAVLLLGMAYVVLAFVGGFESWVSINMTGTNASYLSLNFLGMNDSRLIINTTYVTIYPPTNLTLTKISDYEVYVSWTKGIGAENTMVRAAYGRIPTDRDDGYLVYYGTGSNGTDYAVDLNEGRRYYRAWSQGSSGQYENTGTWAYIGGDMILLVLFGILGLGLTSMFFWKRSPFLAYGAAGAWALLGFQAFVDSGSTNPTNIVDTYMAMFWLCMGFVVGCALLPTIMREKPTKEDIFVDDIDDDGSNLSGILPEKKEEPAKREPKPSRFAETGKL